MKDQTTEPRNADYRAIGMGAEDKQVNNANPAYRGRVRINDCQMDVISACVFNGILHYGILGNIQGENIVGWVPTCLVEVDDEPRRCMNSGEMPKLSYSEQLSVAAMQNETAQGEVERLRRKN